MGHICSVWVVGTWSVLKSLIIFLSETQHEDDDNTWYSVHFDECVAFLDVFPRCCVPELFPRAL